MMHACPKCGFVQPKDKYCANCGLDIDSFKPAPEPLMARLSKNTSLQIAIVILIVLGMAIGIFLSQRDRIAERFAISMPVLSRSIKKPEKTAVPASAMAAPTKEPDVAPPPTETPVLASSGSAKPIVHEIKKFKDLHVSFYEVSKTTLSQLISEGQILNETAQTRSFLWHGSDFQARLKELDPDSRSHGDPRVEPFNLGGTFNIEFLHMGGKRTTEPVGLSITVTPTLASENQWDFNTETNINLKNESGGSLLSTVISGAYSIPPKSMLIIAGILPHQKVFKDDLWSFSGTPLVIYESPEFLNGVTDFVIVFQPK